MASKAKSTRRSGKVTSQSSLSQARRNLDRGNFKQALKDAKACYRKQPSREHRSLLEFALVARAQDLQRHGNRDACRGILENLLELGATEPAVQSALPDLVLWLGMLDRLSSEQVALAGHDSVGWDAKIADQAVLHLEGAPRSRPEMRAAARLVRQALEAIYEGDHAAADLHLRDIPRNSPVAEWKLFVRGLAAYYEHDAERMQNNWSRLDPQRVAARIARPLSVIASGRPPDPSDSSLCSAIAKLESSSVSQALSQGLNLVQRQMAQGQIRTGLASANRIGRGLRSLDPELEQRLVRWLYYQIVQDGRTSDLERFAKSVDPLPMDPRWNRARALVRNCSDHVPRRASLPFWRKYVEDLAGCEALEPAQRHLAQALVWLHLANAHAHTANRLRNCLCGASHGEEVQEAIDEADGCLEKCLELAPRHAPAYFALAELYEAAEEPDKVAGAYRRLLEQVPDNLAALVHLAEYHLGEDEPIDAQQYAARARQAKPLDRQLTTLVWRTHVAAARRCALQGEFDHGRSEFQAADELKPESAGSYDMLGKKACFETKAGSAGRARQLIEQAQETLEEPTPLWLLMTVEASRYELPKEEAWLYEKRWTDTLKRRCRGSTASAMCKLMLAHLQAAGQYHSRHELVTRLVAYLRRCSRVGWQPEELRDVCHLLMEIDEESLLRKLSHKATKRFRDMAFFHMLEGQLEVSQGPFLCDATKARNSLHTAIEVAENSTDPLDQEVLQTSQRSLTALNEIAGDSHIDDFDDDDDDVGAGLPPDFAEPDQLLDAFRAICRSAGLDPEELIASAAPEPGISNPFAGRSPQPTNKRRGKRQ